MSVLLQDKFSVVIGRRRREFTVTLTHESLSLQPLDILQGKRIELSKRYMITCKSLLIDPKCEQDAMFKVVYCQVPKVKCQIFQFHARSDTVEPEKLAALWVASIQKAFQLATKVKSHRQLVFVDVDLEKGRGLAVYRRVKSMLDECGYNHEMVEVTEDQQVKERLRQEPKINTIGGIIAIADETMLGQIIDGIKTRDEWKCLLQTISIGLIPLGGSMGVQRSLCELKKGLRGTPDLVSGLFDCLRGRTVPMDLMQIQCEPDPSEVSLAVSNLGLGLIPELGREIQDTCSLLGCARSWIQFWKILSLRYYKCRISYLPAAANQDQFESLLSRDHLVLEDRLPEGIHGDLPLGWTSEEADFIGVVVSNLPFIDHDRRLAPKSKVNDGTLWLHLIRKEASKSNLKKILNAMNTGEPLDLAINGVEVIKILAFRLQPLDSSGTLTLDGQTQDLCAVQGHILPSVCRIMCER